MHTQNLFHRQLYKITMMISNHTGQDQHSRQLTKFIGPSIIYQFANVWYYDSVSLHNR